MFEKDQVTFYKLIKLKLFQKNIPILTLKFGKVMVMSHLIRLTSNASLSSSNSPRRAVAVAWYTWEGIVLHLASWGGGLRRGQKQRGEIDNLEMCNLWYESSVVLAGL